MADILDQIQRRQAAAQNQQLAQADTNNTWAQTFSSIPASDKVFAAQDLNDMIARVTAQKQAAIEASNPAIALAHARTQEVLDRTQHANDMAPLAVQFKQSQFEAQKALEARRLKEDALANIVKAHEDNFFADRAAFQADHPSATQEELDANDISLRDRYPHARKSKGAGEILSLAERNSMARQREAEKEAAIIAQNARTKAEAEALNIPISGIVSSGALTASKTKPEPTLTEKVKTIEATSAARARGSRAGEVRDSMELFDKDLAAAVARSGGEAKVRPEVWQAFETRKAKLLATPGSYNTDSAAVAPAAQVATGVDHNAALEWANANPNDPRAAAIRARNGL